MVDELQDRTAPAAATVYMCGNAPFFFETNYFHLVRTDKSIFVKITSVVSINPSLTWCMLILSG
jgi:hypothetical protein